MKRRLLIAAVLRLAGAVVNVAVAWGCALTNYTATERVSAEALHDSTIWQVYRFSRTGAVVFVSVRDRSPGGDQSGKAFFARILARNRGVGLTDVGIAPAKLLDDWTGLASPTPEFESG